MAWLGAAEGGRTGESVCVGLWHSTHCEIWLRLFPCGLRKVWHLLQLAMSTTLRRGATADPSTEKSRVLFRPASRTTCCFVVEGSSVMFLYPSMPTVYVPAASSGILYWNVY